MAYFRSNFSKALNSGKKRRSVEAELSALFTKVKVNTAADLMDEDAARRYEMDCPTRKCEITVRLERDATFVGGRYCKYSRSLPQSPWSPDMETAKVTNNSVSEKIGLIMMKSFRADSYRFIASGREDIDVRMLGIGRPFAIQLVNARSVVPLNLSAAEEVLTPLQAKINDDSLDIKVNSLSRVSPKEMVMLNVGQEEKRKVYSCICFSKVLLTEELMEKLRKVAPVEISQKTVIRVLKRRPLIDRKRTIFSMDASKMALNIDFDELERILTSFASDYSDEDVEQAREQANQLMAEQANDQANQVVAEQAEQINRQGAVISKKNEEIITHSGYQFWKQDEYKEKVYWQCWKVKVDRCRARLHTNKASGEVIKVVGTHSCTRSSTAIPLRQISQRVKEAAAANNEHPSSIFNTVLNGVPEAIQAKMDKSAVRKVVQRKRKGINGEPETPNGINFAIPGTYTKYRFGLNDEEPFLLGDSVDADGNRILLFGRESNKNWSAQMKVVFMDGTFKITPSPFYQVYVILAERGGYVFPVLYALLLNKTQAAYERLFEMIKGMWPEFSPTSISVDFEMAVINAIEVCFLDSEVWGCLFHLVQNLKKKLGKKGLKGRYDTDPDFAVLCRMITAMAFVPPDDVIPVFEELWDMLPLELEPILLWMQKNYIGSVTRRDVFIAPRFSHSLWNVYERTLNGSHRTNNFAEAANHRLKVELDVCHPGLWKFINSLRTVQQGRDQKFIQWQAGKRPKGKRTKYVEADRRILTIVQDYENRSTEEFLKGIANNFEMED